MHRLKVLLPAFILSAAVLYILCTDQFRYTENWMQDTLYQRPVLVSPNIFIIGIDEKTLLDLGPFDTWSRSKTAELIDLLCADPEFAPAVIGVDIGFYGEKEARADQLLADAAKRAGNVVTASYVTFGGEVIETDEGGFYARRAVKMVEKPFTALSSVSRSGFTNVLPDADGVIRRSIFSLDKHPVGAPEDGLFSFAAEICRGFAGECPTPPVDADGQWYIPFSGASRDFFGASFSDLLLGRTDPTQFADAIVLIGPYSTGMMDAVHTPISRSEQMYGVEVHANILQALLEQNFKREIPFLAELFLMILLLAFAFTLTRLSDLRRVFFLFVVVTIGYPPAAVGLYHAGWIVPLLVPLITVWSVFFLRVFRNYLTERLEKRRLLQLFGRYVSPQVADSIVREGEANLRLGGQIRDIAVLFVDIRGFTSLSENMAPEEVVQILNRYFDLTTKAIFDSGGMVDKFIGDATMALFNAPMDDADYAMNAVRAGLAIAAGARELQEDILRRFGKNIAMGIGIHCGIAIVGNIGTPFRMDYTAIGDTVNTASRLEGQAGPGEIIISETLYRRLESRIRARCLGLRSLKGKSEDHRIYLVEGLGVPLEHAGSGSVKILQDGQLQHPVMD